MSTSRPKKMMTYLTMHSITFTTTPYWLALKMQFEKGTFLSSILLSKWCYLFLALSKLSKFFVELYSFYLTDEALAWTKTCTSNQSQFVSESKWWSRCKLTCWYGEGESSQRLVKPNSRAWRKQNGELHNKPVKSCPNCKPHHRKCANCL